VKVGGVGLAVSSQTAPRALLPHISDPLNSFTTDQTNTLCIKFLMKNSLSVRRLLFT